jgi:pimeloyl-ACP methyl ester carboxylesterase
VVFGSLTFGLLAAVALAAAPFMGTEADDLVGAVLLGFAAGWALLAGLSLRTDQPQRWAVVPALYMGVGGLLLIALPGASDALDWLWPPTLLVLVIWMVVQARRHLHSRSRRWCVYPVIAVLGLAALGGGVETVQVATEDPLPMPGQLVDVGGHRLHLDCAGTGSPTVVLEAGGGEMAANMAAWVAPAVAESTRVCVYDRAGRGWSEPAATDQDGAQVATDLHTLLSNAGVPGPYVLGGHSFGGLYVQAFAARYPDDVAGLVLIDTTAAADQAETAPDEETGYDPLGRVSTLIAATARFGLARMYAQTDYGDLRPQSRAEVRASLATESTFASTLEEYIQAGDSMAQAAALRDLGDKPLMVLTAGTGSDDDWMADQDDLAALSTNSAHRVVDNASHGSLIADEEDAASTSGAIVDLVAAVRSGTALDD